MEGCSSLEHVGRLRSKLAAYGLNVHLRGAPGGIQWNLVVAIEGVPEIRATSFGVESDQVVDKIKEGVAVLLETYREQVEDAINRM